MTLCPTCGTDWPRNCMSAVAVELLGGCLWCRFGPVRGGDGADGDLERVREEYARRRARVEFRGEETAGNDPAARQAGR